MNNRIATIALAIAAAGITVSAAHAVTGPMQVTAVYTGSVNSSSSNDVLGEFGSPGKILGAASFTATFTLNERVGGAVHPAPGVVLYEGPMTADIMINGHDVVLTPSASLVTVVDAPPGSTNARYAYLVGTTSFSQISDNISFTRSLSLSLGIPAYVPGPPDYRSFAHSGEIWDPVPTGTGFTFSGLYGATLSYPGGRVSESLNLIPDSLTVTAVRAPRLPKGGASPGGGLTGSAVPEPGTWVMMLLGLGALGAVARSRPRTVAQPS